VAGGSQFASWVFSQKVVTQAGLAPSVGAVGTPFENAMVEAFWARMHVELLNRRRWKTRVELASAIHDHIKIWRNTKRRHSALDMLTPSEYENQHQQRQIAA
jgi:putative transposase